MNAIVIIVGSIGVLGGLVAFCFQLLEHSRKQTEKAIAIFYRDNPMECVMMLNSISLKETKKEIANTKHKMEHGF